MRLIADMRLIAIVCFVLFGCGRVFTDEDEDTLVQALCTEEDTNDADYEHCPPPAYITTVEYRNSLVGTETAAQTDYKCGKQGYSGHYCNVRIDLGGGVQIRATCEHGSIGTAGDRVSCWSFSCPPEPDCSI